VAIVTERIVSIHTDWLTVDIEYDDVTQRIESVSVVCNSPYPITWRLAKNKGPDWSGVITDGQSFFDDRPFPGGFKNMDDLGIMEFSWDNS